MNSYGWQCECGGRVLVCFLALSSGTDLGVGRGGRVPLFCPEIFFFCEQCLWDGTSCFVTLDRPPERTVSALYSQGHGSGL